MGLIADTVKRLARSSPPLPSGNGQPWVQRYALPSEREYARDVGDGSGSNLVQAGIAFIQNGFIEAPIQVARRDGEDYEVEPDHAMTQTLKHPNPYYSGALLWKPTLANWLTDGNAYWLLEFSGAGRPARYWWIPSWFIEPKGSATEFITHYEYRPNGRLINLDPSQVVHFRDGLDPHNPLKGCSQLKMVAREIYTDEEAARFTAALLRNMGVPGGVISPKGEVSIPIAEAEDVKAEITQKTSGDRRGEWVVMTSATDLQQYGFTPEQMDLAALRAIPESRVAAALGIPAAVLGFLSGMQQTAVGATLSELRELGYESGIIPKMRLFSEELHAQLLSHYTDNIDQYKVEFDLSDVRVLQEDKDKLHGRLREDVKAGVRMVSSFKIGVGEVPEPGDDVYLRSIAVVESGPDAQQEPAPQTGSVPRPIAASRQYALTKRATKQQLSYLRRIDREGARLGAAFSDELRSAFDDLGQRAAAAWDSQRPTMAFVIADPNDEPTVAAILALLDLERFRDTSLMPLWSAQYQRTASMTYTALNQHLAIDVGTDLPDVIARAVVSAGGRQLGLVDLDASTRSALFDALASLRADGLGPIEAARRIRQYVGAGRYTGMEEARAGSGVRYRSELIARTETLHAQRVSVGEIGKAAGFTQYLAFDNRTGFNDEECLARDGQAYSYEEMLAETANEHPNGTLSFAPVPGSQLGRAGLRPSDVVSVEYDQTTGRIAGSRKEASGVTEIVHVEYDDATGRMAKTWKEEVHG